MEIENIHNFPLGNGVVVHNSKDLSDSLAGAVWNASLHKQNLVDNFQLFATAVDVNEDIDERQEFMNQFQESLSARKNSQDANNKLNDLLSSFGSENILSW